MRVLLPFFLTLLSVSTAEEVDVSKRTDRKSVLRLLRLALSAPDANPEAVVEDMRRLVTDDEIFPGDEELEELLKDVQSEQAPSCANENAALEDDLSPYVDRHVRKVNAVLDDDDCMKREFDASDPDFDPSEAAAVLNKCRLLVIRNVFPKQDVEDYRTSVAGFLNDVHFGKITNGTTTLNENDFYSRRSPKRFDVLFPKSIMSPAITANANIVSMFQDAKAFGTTDFRANMIGTVIAEKGAPNGQYHYDDSYLFDSRSFERYGIAAGDVPPYAVTAFIPLQDTTIEHGPTEFCMGTNYMKGMDYMNPRVRDKALIAKGTAWYDLARFERDKESCPERFRRLPLGNKGDVVFFDYTITHRGTANVSPTLRVMAYIFFSRRWYRDSNFEDESLSSMKDKRKDQLRKMLATTRFAIVNKDEDFSYKPVPLDEIANFMNPQTKVTLTNTDVENASLYSGETYVRDVPVGQKISLNVPMRSTLTLYNHSSETDITSWEIGQEEKEISLRANDLVSAS